MTLVHSSPIPKTLSEFRVDPIAFLRGLSHTQGDLAHFRMAGRHFVLANHPDAIRETLVTRQSSFAKGPGLLRAEPLLGNGLLTSDGVDHRRQRRQLQPAFSLDRLNEYEETMIDLARVLRDAWSDGETRDVHAEMSRLTLEIAVKTLFASPDIAPLPPNSGGGVSRGAEVGVGVCPHAQISMDGIGDAITDAIFARFGKLTEDKQYPPTTDSSPRIGGQGGILPLPQNGKGREQNSPTTQTPLHAAVDQLLQRHAAAEDTLLALLFQDTGLAPEIQEAERRDQAMTFLIAGHESVSVALAWAWGLLARNPDAEARFHAEIDAWDGEEISALAYTRAVIAETMRLYPPAWMVSREAQEEVVIGGETLALGTIVVVAPCVTHRDPRFFPNPDAFQPERWLGAETWPRFAYVPFGAGARKCIGDEFAWREMILLMATLGRAWTLRPAFDADPAPQPIVTLRPRGGMPMRFARRS